MESRDTVTDRFSGEESRDLAYGPCATYIPDNAKSLLGPSVLPSLTECGIEIALPPTSMPTAKARIERFFGTLKSLLRQQPLPVVDMRRAEEHGYDVGRYAILITQLQDLVDQAVRIHNNSVTTEFSKLSPNEQLAQDAQQNARSLFYDTERLEHHIGVITQAVLDRNGVRKFGLRWRHKHYVRALLKNLKRTLKPDRIKIRKDGSAAYAVKVWYNPGDLSSFKVFDETEKRWVRLDSTEPEYTHRLSMGAHLLFERRRKQRNETLKHEDDRMASVARTRRELNELVPDLSFQQRRRYAALFESKEVRRVSKRSYPAPECETPSLDRAFGSVVREDNGLPGDARFSFEEAERDLGDHFEDFGTMTSSDWEDRDFENIDFDAIEAVSGSSVSEGDLDAEDKGAW
jgi:hypothetical protein